MRHFWLALALAGCSEFRATSGDAGPGNAEPGDAGPSESSLQEAGASTGNSADGGSPGDRDAALDADGSAIDSSTPTDAPTTGVTTVAIPPSAPGSFTYTAYSSRSASPISTTVVITRGFDMDVTEVTVGRFREWQNAGMPPPCLTGTCSLDEGGAHASTMVWNSAWNHFVGLTSFKDTSQCQEQGVTATFVSGPEDAPINCVSWYQAASFCFWDGKKRLPTLLEAQYVATGRGSGYAFPWGDAPPPDCAHAISGGPNGTNACGFPKPVGTAAQGVSRDGVLDLAGSVDEWVWDSPWGLPPATLADDYSTSPADPPSSQLARGGGFATSNAWLPSEQQMFDRGDLPADGFSADLGFRCVRSK